MFLETPDFPFYSIEILNDTLEYDLSAVKNVFRSSYHVKIHESLRKTVVKSIMGVILSTTLRFYFTCQATEV